VTSGSDTSTNEEILKTEQIPVSLPTTVMIITDDMPLIDGDYCTTDRYRTIGKCFADAFWNLVDIKNIRKGTNSSRYCILEITFQVIDWLINQCRERNTSAIGTTIKRDNTKLVKLGMQN